MELDFSNKTFMKFHAKIKKVKWALAEWSKQTYNDIFQKVATLEDVISAKECQSEINPTQENCQELKKGRSRI